MPIVFDEVSAEIEPQRPTEEPGGAAAGQAPGPAGDIEQRLEQLLRLREERLLRLSDA